MSSKRLNVLVYSGNGSTVESVRHCLFTLRRLLAPNYAVIPVTGDMIIKEPWTATCAALVFPGGADQGYCRTLNGEGNRRIRQYVERGGKYIGFCAGGYYGSKRCEFEVGNRLLEVIGDRELAFYPGTDRGCAFGGFVYHSEKGARAADLSVNKAALSSGSIPNVFKTYYNGGGVFVDAPKFKDQGVEVLASYTEKLDVDPGEVAAAVVYCQVGEGAALLTGPHPEFVFFGKPADNWSLTKPRFAASNLEEPKEEVPGFKDVVNELAKDEKHRMDFLKACLTKLGLTVSDQQNVPSLSRIHLSASLPSNAASILSALTEIFVKDAQGEDLVKDENDIFHIVQTSTWNMAKLAESLPTEGQMREGTEEQTADEDVGSSSDRIINYNAIIKQLLIHDSDLPDGKATPYFNHKAFFANLSEHDSLLRLSRPTFGTHILYGEVVTSTNTLLEKNTRILRRLPHGLTFTATTQLAGRGRGSNVWVSPPGSLMFSTIIRHPMSSMSSAPVIFVQYLAAMAIVQGIKSYSGKVYDKIPIKLKWPNDIFALDPVKAASNGGDRPDNYSKIGGILVNSHYNSTEYIAVCGVGINVSNAAPTTSLNQLIDLLPTTYRNSAQPFTIEKLLASILAAFESLYTQFLVSGFDESLEKLYYKDWLHMDQIVTLETEGDARARIKGITRDFGLLVAEELGWEDRPTGKRFELMSDSNSFDFFKGLVKRKK